MNIIGKLDMVFQPANSIWYIGMIYCLIHSICKWWYFSIERKVPQQLQCHILVNSRAHDGVDISSVRQRINDTRFDDKIYEGILWRIIMKLEEFQMMTHTHTVANIRYKCAEMPVLPKQRYPEFLTFHRLQRHYWSMNKGQSLIKATQST